MTATTIRPNDLSPAIRAAMIAGGGAMTIAAAIALGRAFAGLAPSIPQAKDLAVIVHVATVIPAVPLGLYVMLTRKGDARHRMLGKIWMLMMLVTALSAIFIRHINHGGFSFIHLFVPLTIVGMVRAIAAARAGRIDRHRRMLITLYLGGLLIPGAFAFLPSRIMGLWLFG
ncbi:DUF2306 domain-containing protein [Sphingomonas sp. AOB5]|uniref:DUF2306 domain-containing protein n=1 Tax=Sphingomonas sp. AOB5 TaxID=3034017 RepID=UPI0023F6FFE5|nr:DUF2306 domain-containing protein [Sphingomonas sp. AOB5]MDF7776331.1 DUF2306 domain-containing protein [Sphingomonas sp. AOB5]